jgi:5-methyltetrahydropteroyltriglutamate--homocysteine methyltransferase
MRNQAPVSIQTTMTGSWFRPPEILGLIKPERCPTGEIGEEHGAAVEAAERRAIRDQLHPLGSERGLDWVSNGEQRKAGYTYFIPNRFHGFSKTERARVEFPRSLFEELAESNPAYAQQLSAGESGFMLPKIDDRLSYHGEELARREARDALRLAREEGGGRIFVPTPSPGVVTIFFPDNGVYRDHSEYLFAMAKELRKEYEALLSVDGVDIQLDSPDLAMGKQTASWGEGFYDVLPSHVDAINEAVAGLPAERIRVHYCYGNWVGSHLQDADFRRVLPEVLGLRVGTLVGEMANPRHIGDTLVISDYLREHDWPKGLKLAEGVIDVKTPIVETPETVAARLDRVVSLEKLGPERVLGGTDCGFETFAYMTNVTYSVGLQKLKSLTEGASLESHRLGAS